MASSEKKFPGFGLPVDHTEARSPFPTALNSGWGSLGVTLREQRMMDFINKITDKAGWETKVFDEDIVARWRAEADQASDTVEDDVYLSKQMFDFVGPPAE